MTYEISKDFAFDAAHRLRDLPPEHKCGRLHGHSYTARVTLIGDRLDEHGFLLDYGDLAPVKAYIDDTLDHRYLNEIEPFDTANPTAENLACFLTGVVARCLALPHGVEVVVAVSETGKTWATYRTGGA